MRRDAASGRREIADVSLFEMIFGVKWQFEVIFWHERD